jgi:hypothetical protein
MPVQTDAVAGMTHLSDESEENKLAMVYVKTVKKCCEIDGTFATGYICLIYIYTLYLSLQDLVQNIGI